MASSEFLFDRVTADVRQHLAGLTALADQLARQRLAPDAQACALGITDLAASLSRVMDAARDLKRADDDGLSVTPAPVRLRDLVDQIEARWRPRAAASGVTLLVAYDGDPEASALVDATRLLQLYDGFIGEAVCGQGRGAVEAVLAAHVTEAGIRLTGRVRGPRDFAWDASDAEARVDAIAERLGLEVALGALLARRILTRMGGKFRREANAGASDTVTFELLLAPIPVTTEAPAEPRGRGAHILVVDDNATNRMVAQSLVEMFDCTSEAAEDGEEAVEIASSGRFDLILMDIRMPRMDGVAATRAIRALPGAAGAVPIIALTANADPEDAEGYLAAGMNGVVEKPMKPEHLLSVLKRALAPAPASKTAAAA